MQGRALRDGLVFVAPYDDPYTIAGQGTIGTEILRQLTTLQDDNLHAIFVAIGGGGLIAGIGAYVKALKPHVKIIGVEPTGRAVAWTSSHVQCRAAATLSSVQPEETHLLQRAPAWRCKVLATSGRPYPRQHLLHA